MAFACRATMKKPFRYWRAMTLTELLIVIAMLAILAALILPRFTGSVEQGRASEAVGILNAIRMGEESYKNENGNYKFLAVSDSNADWNEIGLDNPNSNANRFFNYSVEDPAVAGQILIVAERHNNPPGNPFFNYGSPSAPTVIALNQAGIWSGHHPLRPQNASNCCCSSTDTPPCQTPDLSSCTTPCV